MLTFMIVIVLIISFLVAFSFFQERSRKINLIQTNSIVCVYTSRIAYQNLPMNNYGIFINARNRNKAEIIFPKLTENGDVEYIFSWHDLSDIDIPTQDLCRKDIQKLRVMKQLAPLINEHLQIEPEILALEKQYFQIKNLINLISTSNIYVNYLDTYEKSLIQIENILWKAENLQKIYIRLIREILIGVQVAKHNPEILETLSATFDFQYQQTKAAYDNIKDVANTYLQLLNY